MSVIYITDNIAGRVHNREAAVSMNPRVQEVGNPSNQPHHSDGIWFNQLPTPAVSHYVWLRRFWGWDPHNRRKADYSCHGLA